MSLMDLGNPGYDDAWNDCGCGGDAECPSPECVAGRVEAAADLVDERMDQR